MAVDKKALQAAPLPQELRKMVRRLRVVTKQLTGWALYPGATSWRKVTERKRAYQKSPKNPPPPPSPITEATPNG